MKEKDINSLNHTIWRCQYHTGHLLPYNGHDATVSRCEDDRQIGKTDTPMPPEERQKRIDQSGFVPYKTRCRKPGTGGAYQLNDHRWEGKYSPKDAHGKRLSRYVYAKTRKECEEKLAEMIVKTKDEIAAQKENLKAIGKT